MGDVNWEYAIKERDTWLQRYEQPYHKWRYPTFAEYLETTVKSLQFDSNKISIRTVQKAYATFNELELEDQVQVVLMGW